MGCRGAAGGCRDGSEGGIFFKEIKSYCDGTAEVLRSVMEKGLLPLRGLTQGKVWLKKGNRGMRDKALLLSLVQQ